MSTAMIVMRVDLDCDRCYKKIRKVLCKLQDRENIKMISYDEKSNMVTVAGSFDAEDVSDRLCSSAGKVITDIQVARGNQIMPSAKHPGKESQAGHKEGHGGKGNHGQQGHGHGNGQQGHGHAGGGQQGHGHAGGGGGKPDKTRHVKFDMDDEEFDQQGHGHAGGGGKPADKARHVKFDMDDEEFDQHAHHGGKGHGHAEKPRVFTTTAMSRNEAPRPQQQPASMAAMAPMRMPTPGPSMTMMPQALSAPSIWPAPLAAPAYGYGGAPPAGGYYGGPVYDHGGYGAYGVGGYGRNPYQPQYYEEEPSAGCSVM